MQNIPKQPGKPYVDSAQNTHTHTHEIIRPDTSNIQIIHVVKVMIFFRLVWLALSATQWIEFHSRKYCWFHFSPLLLSLVIWSVLLYLCCVLQRRRRSCQHHQHGKIDFVFVLHIIDGIRQRVSLTHHTMAYIYCIHTHIVWNFVLK